MPDSFVLESDRAYQQILELILGDELDATQPLSERKLADSLEMGRTPVREAIRRLTREGLVEVRPARGTYVRRLTLREVEEIYEARIGIESMAAFLAAQRGPTEAFRKFRDTFEEMIAAPDQFDLHETHAFGQAFHVEMFRASQNRFLLELYEPLRLRHRVALGLPRMYNHDWVLQSVKEHHAILDTIERRDADGARRLICEHLAKGLEVRSEIFQSFAQANQPKLKHMAAG